MWFPGADVSLADVSAGRDGLLVMFICAHCPFVLHVEDELARLGKDYAGSAGLGIVAISSNSIETHPEDAPDKLKAMADRLGFNFPYLYDGSQQAAKDYTAACTPDFFLFDGLGRLVYRGRLDGSRPGNECRWTAATCAGDRCPAGWRTGASEAGAECRLQHQMGARQRACLFWIVRPLVLPRAASISLDRVSGCGTHKTRRADRPGDLARFRRHSLRPGTCRLGGRPGGV